MEDSMYVVVLLVGGLIDGFTMVGPFPQYDKALAWAERMARNAAWEVVELDDPHEVA